VETALLRAVAERAAASGADRLIGEYVATLRNVPARDFYAGHGFQGEGDRWIWEFARGSIALPSHLTVNSSVGTKPADGFTLTVGAKPTVGAGQTHAPPVGMPPTEGVRPAVGSPATTEGVRPAVGSPANKDSEFGIVETPTVSHKPTVGSQPTGSPVPTVGITQNHEPTVGSRHTAGAVPRETAGPVPTAGLLPTVGPT